MNLNPEPPFALPEINQALFESMPFGIIYNDASGRIFAANQAAQRILGLTLEQILGSAPLDPGWRLVHEDGREIPREERPAVRALRSGLTVSNMVMGVMQLNSDRCTWIETTAVPQFKPGMPAPWMAIVTFTDITERKQAEAAAQKNRAKLLAALDSLSDAVFISDTEGRFIDFNEGFATFHRFKNKAECARTLQEYPDFLDVYLPDGSLAPLELWAVPRALRGETVMNAEYGLHRKDTGDRWIGSYNFAPIRAADGTIVGSVVVGRDITAQKQTEQQVRQLTRLYATLSQINQAIVRTSDLAGLFREICQIAVQYGQFRLAWVGLYDPASGQVQPVAASGPLPFSEINVHQPPFRDGLIGIAVREGLAAFSGDVQTDARMLHWRAAAQVGGYHAAAAIPLRRGGVVVGLLVLFSAEVNFFISEDEQKLLAEIGLDISYALDMDQREASRRRAEADLRASEAALKQSQAVAHLGHWTWETRNNQLTWSDEMFRVFGYQPGAAPSDLNAVVAQAIHPDDRARVEQANQAVIERQAPAPMEYRVIWPDGSVHWVWAQPGERVTDEQGNILSLTGIVLDITARRQAEEQITRLAERLDLATRAAHLGVWDWDVVRDHLVWDTDMYRLYGVKAEDFSGAYEAWLNGLYPQERESTDQIVQLALRGEKEYDTEFRVVWPDASVHWLRALGHVIRDERGMPLRMVGINYDITARKRAEEEIRKLNASLEQRVAERTRQLELANRELEAFSYSVSHDLRAPLRGIDGWSLALLEDYGEKLDDEGRLFLKKLRGEAGRMNHLIDDLLRLSRVSRAEMLPGPVNLSRLATTIAGRLQEANPARRFEWAIQPELVAEGDMRLLEIALTNLLDNAAKFTGLQPVARIEFCRVRLDEETAFLVKDNGVGFDLAAAKNLFGAFQRMHSTEEFPGSGVGLATVQRIIHRHGGRIWAEAQAGQGAAFYFTLGKLE